MVPATLKSKKKCQHSPTWKTTSRQTPNGNGPCGKCTTTPNTEWRRRKMPQTLISPPFEDQRRPNSIIQPLVVFFLTFDLSIYQFVLKCRLPARRRWRNRSNASKCCPSPCGCGIETGSRPWRKAMVVGGPRSNSRCPAASEAAPGSGTPSKRLQSPSCKSLPPVQLFHQPGLPHLKRNQLQHGIHLPAVQWRPKDD